MPSSTNQLRLPFFSRIPLRLLPPFFLPALALDTSTFSILFISSTSLFHSSLVLDGIGSATASTLSEHSVLWQNGFHGLESDLLNWVGSSKLGSSFRSAKTTTKREGRLEWILVSRWVGHTERAVNAVAVAQLDSVHGRLQVLSVATIAEVV